MNPYLSVLAVGSNQACDLRHAQPRDLGHQCPYHAALLLAQRKVPLLDQSGLQPRIPLGPALSAEIDSSTAAEKLRDPNRVQGFQIFHVNPHTPRMVADPNISGSFCFGNTPRFRIILYWTILLADAGFGCDRLLWRLSRNGQTESHQTGFSEVLVRGV